MRALILMLLLFSCGKAKEMPSYKSVSSIQRLEAQDEVGFSLLPLKGTVDKNQTLWSGDFWHTSEGSINKRWYQSIQDPNSDLSPTQAEIFTMTVDQVAGLSPAEKFDIYQGRYDYALKDDVKSRAPKYGDLAIGWAMASINHPEPTSKVVQNADGIVIPFGSSDLKALLSYYYAFNANQGQRLFMNIADPGSFHVVLTNRVGRRNESFIMDGFPIYAFETTVEDEATKPVLDPSGIQKTVILKTIVTFIDESAENSWNPVRGTPNQTYMTITYRYRLFLNYRFDIVRGEWIGRERPKKLWVDAREIQFEGPLANLETLLN